MLQLRVIVRAATTTLPLVIALLVCGCSGGGGGSDLNQTLAVNRAPYVILDLETGERIGRQTVDLTDPSYTAGTMVFRRIDGGSRSLGSPAEELGHQSDEDLRTVELDPYYIAVYELTIGQWQALMADATPPWEGLAAPLGNNDSQAPAHAMGHADALAVVSAVNALAGDLRVALPTDHQWEAACRADLATASTIDSAYNFAPMRSENGEQIAPPAGETIAAHAWLFSSAGNDGGPQVVGSLSASPAGLYDMHGNVWEWTGEQHLRGGSWRDDALAARAANKLALDDPALRHPLAGMRLVMMP